MDMPKFVKYIDTGDGDGAGIKYGDVLKVLTYGRFHPTYLYVETPIQSKYCGSSAMNENKLKGKKFTYLADCEYEIIKEEKQVDKFVKYTGESDCGIKKGDIAKVLSESSESEFIYIETVFQDEFSSGSLALNPHALKGKSFMFTNSYEPVEEGKKVETKHKFKVGDIVCGNSMGRYGYTNSNMTKGKVVDVNPHTGFIDIKVLKHKLYNDNGNTTFTDLDYRYFDLVESKSAVVPQIPTPDNLYHITTDMKTFVDVEHNGNKGWSKCDTRYDKFDIYTGVDLALERLDEVENPPVPELVKELPKYVKYIGASGLHGLNNGDICRVLSGVVKGTTMYDDTLFVVSPSPTLYNNANASNPSALAGVNFTYLWPDKYEIVDFNIHD